MDKSVICDLVFSGKCYAEKIETKESEANTKCYEELEKKLEKLCEGMTKEEKEKTLWDIDMLQADIASTISKMYFQEGFKLGMKIAAQSLLDWPYFYKVV